MKKLSLTNAEFNHLRDIYLGELDKALKRVEHLTAILKKINADFDPPKEEELMAQYQKLKPTKPSAEKKAVPKRKVATKSAAKRKAGARTRKPIVDKGRGKDKVKWNDFVIKAISDKKSPSLSSEIYELALKEFKVPQSDAPKVKRVISGALSKLVTMEKKLQTQKLPNSREKWYGLPGWFNEKGELKPEFAARESK
ncbi:MAG: hypothetical protein RBT19_05400 [Tenuifilaceae bacterium]|jgi:hypothetical protein|uniref:hypothetical protein n=1 Tax=Perlabentimonas gracilis TaxID=2715279 RepID=UPI001409180B|nr:hypothetical protein [Perlabentimonas gracilis]MDX9769777.1 hypothetical protein [Tenuifilaceae bacterium]NHB69483.1 hypothetical protein [Perlabentimonas gracilis]